MPEPLHIVCLGAPSPLYGGGIEMFEKIKALATLGRQITLHYFMDHRSPGVDAVQEHCVAVYAYKRKGAIALLTSPLPYIVSSRINQELAHRLGADNHDILLDGFHCAGLLAFLKPAERNIIIRVHNDEAAYYQGLAASAFTPATKVYFSSESRRLHRFQQRIPKHYSLAALSMTDVETVRNRYGFHHVAFIPAFIPWTEVTGAPGSGTYCLYHGNLSVAENERAASWLVREVFPGVGVPLVIAGQAPSRRLQAEIARSKEITLIADPSVEALARLIREAHLHVLPSFNNTGVKLKLLHALFEGRFCLTNEAGARGSATGNAAIVAEGPAAWRSAIASLMEEPFTAAHVEERKAALRHYDNAEGARQINALLSKRYR